MFVTLFFSTGGDRLDNQSRRSAHPAPSASRMLSGYSLLRLLLCLLSVAALAWLALSIHPATGTAAVRPAQRTDLSQRVDNAVVNTAADTLSQLAVGEGDAPAVPVIRKVYTIPEDTLTPPAPDPAAYGVTDDPAVIQSVIESAAALLEGQELVWNAGIEFAPDSHLAWYYDESILAIAWKEAIGRTVCSFIEVKIADGSQLRRALAGGTYSSSVASYATEMARRANAVVAINGDFYTFRIYGITVYQRQIYRCAPQYVDTAYFTASGDMLFSRRGSWPTRARRSAS